MSISELTTVTAGAGKAVLSTPDGVVLAVEGVPSEHNPLGERHLHLVTAAQCKTRVGDSESKCKTPVDEIDTCQYRRSLELLFIFCI